MEVLYKKSAFSGNKNNNYTLKKKVVFVVVSMQNMEKVNHGGSTPANEEAQNTIRSKKCDILSDNEHVKQYAY